MHEFALRTRPDTNAKEKYLSIRPTGMVVQAFSRGMKRRKWMEIIADLCSPKKRGGNAAGLIHRIGQPAWDALCERWTPALRERWLALDILPESAEKDLGRSLWWDDEVEKVSGFRLAMGRDKGGTADLLDAFPFSAHSRRAFYIVTNSDLSETEASTRGGTTRSILDGKPVEHAVCVVPWETDLGLTQLQRDRIRSRNFEIHPRFDAPLAKPLFRDGLAYTAAGRL